MTIDDALTLLKLQPGATEEDVKRAFRLESQKYHPDLYATQASHVQEVMSERFQQLAAARDLLLNGAGRGRPTEAPPDIGEMVERVRAMHHQRRFSDALRELDSVMSRYALHENIDLLVLRFEILRNAEQYGAAAETLQRMRSIDGSIARDAQYLEALATMQVSARHFDAALSTIAELESLAGYDIPLYLQLKGQTLIMAGRVDEAEAVVNRLAQLDPTNPLVRQRAEYIKVGNSYVGKSEATTAACAACAIIELLFDCL